MFCGIFSVLYVGIMASFELFDDEDGYGDMFITQTPRQDTVSLEENGEINEFRTVLDEKYSDISDEESDGLERRLRYGISF